MKDFDKRLLWHIPIVKECKTCETIELTSADIEDWLNHCVDPEVLRYIARRAKTIANQLEEDDNDDFRSMV
jgi:hypothetical protein